MAHSYFTHIPHYLPFSGEISAMRIQGEGRNWPDAGSFSAGTCGYDESIDTSWTTSARNGQNPTGPSTMTCPIEMSMQENRYRRMLTPDVQMHVNREMYTTASDDFGSSSYSPPVGSKLHPTSEIKWSDFYGKNKVYKAQTTGGVYTGNAINRKSNEQSYYFAGSKNVGVSKSGVNYITNYGGFVAAGFGNHTDAAGFTTSSTTGGTWRSHTVNPQATQISFMADAYVRDRRSDGTYGATSSLSNMLTVTHLVWYASNPGVGFVTNGNSNILVCHMNILGRIYFDPRSLRAIHWPTTPSEANSWTSGVLGPATSNFWYPNTTSVGVDISYEAPSANNRYFGQTTFRASCSGPGNGYILPISLSSLSANPSIAEHPIGIEGSTGNFGETS